MIKITELKQTCTACPSQWEGKAEDNSHFYARYRWGTLRVELEQRVMITKQIGDDLDGHLSYEALKSHVCSMFELPDYCEER